MSKNKLFKSLNILNMSNKSNIKPRNDIRINTFNNTGHLNNNGNINIYKLNQMKPGYKQLYKDIITKKINSDIGIKIKKIEKPKRKGNKLDYKLNSFLDIAAVNKDSQILFQFNKLKFKILKNKHHSYFSVNKSVNSKIEDLEIKDSQDISFLAYNGLKKNPKKLHKNQYIKRNNNIKNINITDINSIKPILNKYLNSDIDTNTNMNSTEIEKKVIEDNNTKKYENDGNNLISENSKLKKELEYSNNQLKRYKKYQELYLNLLKRVKSEKNLIKTLNLNDERNIKESYINELIDRGKEINTILNENNILENNIKDMLYKLE